MPLRQIFPPIEGGPSSAGAPSGRRFASPRERNTFVMAKKPESTETFPERINQREVSSSLIGAVLAISVGNMLSYIARAS
jgi:hypothetical protein